MWALSLAKRIGGVLFGNPMLLAVLAVAAWGGRHFVAQYS